MCYAGSMRPRSGSKLVGRAALLVVSGVVAACLPGCGNDGGVFGGRACTTIGCADGFHVALSPTAGWPAGSYEVVIETEAGKTTCQGELPVTCDVAGITCTTVPDRGEKNPRVGVSGCALGPNEQGYADIQLPDGPASVRVHIAHEGKTLVEQSFSPEYQTSQPNGPGCEPVCRQASGSITVF